MTEEEKQNKQATEKKDNQEYSESVSKNEENQEGQSSRASEKQNAQVNEAKSQNSSKEESQKTEEGSNTSGAKQPYNTTKKQTSSDSKSNKEKKEDKPQKDHAIANGIDLPISTKYAVDICKFIRGLPIEKAISKLEEVEKKMIAVPMKGEYGHKKHAKKFASGSGKYPQKAAKEFIKLLRNLSANSVSNGLENPVISEASANVGSRPMARFGMWKRKRTHLKLIAKEKTQKNKVKTKQIAK